MTRLPSNGALRNVVMRPRNWLLAAALALAPSYSFAGKLEDNIRRINKETMHMVDQELNRSFNVDSALMVHIPDISTEIKTNPSRVIVRDKEFDRSVHCLALNIYFESAFEPIKGKQAVALVTLNRMMSPFFPKTVCDVVYQRNKNRRGKMVSQFSWVGDKRFKRPRNVEMWEESYYIALDMLTDFHTGRLNDFTGGATHYHATYVKPKWRKAYEKVTQIGLHIFYRSPRYGVYIASTYP